MIDSKLRNNKVLIIGMGLMGGSLARALYGKCEKIYGVDIDTQTLEFAINNKIIDHGGKSVVEIEPDYDIVVLALPVHMVIHELKHIPKYIPEGVLIIDLGSTKKEIVAQMNQLPEGYYAVGGHPICGKEQSSIFSSSADLYKESKFILINTERTTLASEILTENLVKSVGSIPVWMSADLHDEILAMTSHLPYLVSNALAGSVSDHETLVFGPGFKSTIRIAGSDVDMFMDILTTNKKNILEKLRKYSILLSKIEYLLETDQLDALHVLLDGGRRAYYSIYNDKETE